VAKCLSSCPLWWKANDSVRFDKFHAQLPSGWEHRPSTPNVLGTQAIESIVAKDYLMQKEA